MTDPVTRLNAALEGRYRIERELGEGGMATVYLAEDLRHERKVALKVLKPELAAVVGAERFLAEIKTTANLRHPHILPLHDSGEANGFLYFVMPFLDGESLRDRIDREKQLPVDEAVSIASKVAAALQHAHMNGVIHRDIKPANILLQDGEPVVADFGIALAAGVAGGTRLTETGLSVGTPYYMSPEQATGDQDVGPASDTYGLACVLYEMLVGDPPYSGSTAQAVLGKVIQGLPVSATSARGSVPRNVDAAIRKALERLPADRFTAAQDFARALADPGFTHGEVADAFSTAAAGGWRPLALGALGLAAILAAGLGWSLLRLEPTRNPIRFEVSLNGVTLRSGGLWGAEIALSPDGASFVFTGGLPAQLWLRRFDSLEPTPVAGSEASRDPRFSPDGQSIAFVRGDQILIASLSAGTVSTIVGEGVGVQGLAWGPDNNLYFPRESGIWRMPAEGGEMELVIDQTEEGDQFAWPEVLPGANRLLLTRLVGGGVTATIATMSLETGDVQDLFPGAMARYADSGHVLYALLDGTLLAAPFDPETGEVTGASRTVAEGVRVNPIGGSLFAISPTGVFVYQAGQPGSDYRLQVSSLDGPGSETLPLPPQNITDPRWSPDGRLLAYASGPMGEENIFVYDVLQGTAPRQMTFAGSNIDPVWSPDGTRLVFASLRGGIPDIELFVKSVDEDTPEERILELRGQQYPRQWLPNDVIVFESGLLTASDLWSVPAEAGAEPTPYIASPEDVEDIAISPDGNWAVYQSAETGFEELYARSFPEPRQQLRVSEAGGQFPRWSSDGSTLYYWSAEQLDIDTLYAATVSTQPTFAVLSRRIVHIGDYAEEDWDLHPDGDRLAAAQAVDPTRGSADHVVVVQNFFEVLRQVVPE